MGDGIVRQRAVFIDVWGRHAEYYVEDMKDAVGLLEDYGYETLTRGPYSYDADFEDYFTQKSLRETVEYLKRVSDDDDELFIYIRGHGSKAATIKFQGGKDLYAKKMAASFRGIAYGQRTILVDTCYAATWKRAWANKKTLFAASSAPNRKATDTLFGKSFLTKDSQIAAEGFNLNGDSIIDHSERFKYALAVYTANYPNSHPVFVKGEHYEDTGFYPSEPQASERIATLRTLLRGEQVNGEGLEEFLERVERKHNQRTRDAIENIIVEVLSTKSRREKLVPPEVCETIAKLGYYKTASPAAMAYLKKYYPHHKAVIPIHIETADLAPKIKKALHAIDDGDGFISSEELDGQDGKREGYMDYQRPLLDLSPEEFLDLQWLALQRGLLDYPITGEEIEDTLGLLKKEIEDSEKLYTILKAAEKLIARNQDEKIPMVFRFKSGDSESSRVEEVIVDYQLAGLSFMVKTLGYEHTLDLFSKISPLLSSPFHYEALAATDFELLSELMVTLDIKGFDKEHMVEFATFPYKHSDKPRAQQRTIRFVNEFVEKGCDDLGFIEEVLQSVPDDEIAWLDVVLSQLYRIGIRDAGTLGELAKLSGGQWGRGDDFLMAIRSDSLEAGNQDQVQNLVSAIQFSNQYNIEMDEYDFRRLGILDINDTKIFTRDQFGSSLAKRFNDHVDELPKIDKQWLRDHEIVQKNEEKEMDEEDWKKKIEYHQTGHFKWTCKNIARTLNLVHDAEKKQDKSDSIRIAFSEALSPRAAYLLIALGSDELSKSSFLEIWKAQKIKDVKAWVEKIDPEEEYTKQFFANLCELRQGKSKVCR